MGFFNALFGKRPTKMEPEKSLTPEEIAFARLEIERGRFELEKAKSELRQSFFGRNSSILVPAAVSFAAVVVSLGQVWVTKISKDKELELAALQKNQELQIQDAQRKRELDISAARFVTENRQPIFNGTQDEQELFASLISTLFPIEVSGPLLRRLQRTSPKNDAWTKAFQAWTGQTGTFSPDGRLLVTVDPVEPDHLLFRDIDSGKIVKIIKTPESLKAVKFSPDGQNLITTSVSGLTQTFGLGTGKLLKDSSK